MVENLVKVEYDNRRVLLTSQIAEMYGVEPEIISNNFNRNKDRYQEGIDFCVLSGEELKFFKTTHQFDESWIRVNKLYLWYEHGALLHAKSINTDKAWNVYGDLVDLYFRVKEISNTEVKKKVNLPEYIESIGIVGKYMRMNDVSMLDMFRKGYNTLGVPCDFLPNYVKAKVTFSATTLLQRNNINMTARKFNSLMVLHEFLEYRERKSTSHPDKTKRFWSLTDKGLEFGENQKTPCNPLETQPLYYEDTFLQLIGIITEKGE